MTSPATRLAELRRDLALLARTGWGRAPEGSPGRARKTATPLLGGLRLTRGVRAAGTELEVVGAEQLAELDTSRPLLLVANHGHERDAELVRAALPAALSRRLTVLGPRAQRLAGHRPPALTPSLTPGPVWLVFGDGAPTPDGRVGRFRSEVVTLARRRGAVVVPVALRGSFALPRRRPSPVQVLTTGAPRVSVRLAPPFDEAALGTATAAEVAERLRAVVVALLDEDVRTWWAQQRGGVTEAVPDSPWRRVWAATAPAAEGANAPRRIWR